MPRYRKLHAKIVESYDFNEMPDDFTRLLWVMLPLQLSREGTIPADAVLIRSRVFPLRGDVTCEKIDAALAWYAEHGMIRYYEADGRRYLWAVNFAKYQGVTTKESESNYPPPPAQWAQDSEPTTEQVKSNAGASQEQVAHESSTDALFNSQYADSDSDANAAAIVIPPSEIVDNIVDNSKDAAAASDLGDWGDYSRVETAWLGLHGGETVKREHQTALGWLCGSYGDDLVLATIRHVKAKGRVVGHPNYIAAILGTEPPTSETVLYAHSEEDRRRYVEGKYAAYFKAEGG